METIGRQNIWSFFDQEDRSRPTSNGAIRAGAGHEVQSYFDLAKKIAELQFLNRDHVLLFRGQKRDFQTTKRNSMLKASIFRIEGASGVAKKALVERFQTLKTAESELVKCYESEKLKGLQRVKRHRIIRWAILQHYEVCATPLLDVTHSLRISASFASSGNDTQKAFLFAFGVPNLSGAITASAEAGLQVIRLSSACPPNAVRPHIQEGYLLGEYPEIAEFEQIARYQNYEMDFGRRLIAKFRFNPRTFWGSRNYPRASDEALYPGQHRDPLLEIAKRINMTINKESA